MTESKSPAKSRKTVQKTKSSDDVELIKKLRQSYLDVCKELSKAIIGQEDVIKKILICILSRGHGLLMGVPGLAKTTIVNSLAQAMHLEFKRIQFTPDLMPSDITGTDILQDSEDEPGKRVFHFIKGPIFANIVLADEINRTPPKTQSALLEAMAERSITVAGRHLKLPAPFFVLATQNPIEQEGTYSLPEAQLDRFMFLINVGYPSEEEEGRIARETTGKIAEKLNAVITAKELIGYQEVVERVPVPDHIYDAAVKIVRASRPATEDAPEWLKKWVSWGAGPRAIQYLIRGAKARAVLEGSYLARMEDLQAVAEAVLEHRIITNFQAQAEGMTSQKIIARLVTELTEDTDSA